MLCLEHPRSCVLPSTTITHIIGSWACRVYDPAYSQFFCNLEYVWLFFSLNNSCTDSENPIKYLLSKSAEYKFTMWKSSDSSANNTDR